MIDVKALGAIGDGVADDTGPIQAAIDAARATTFGDRVWFPAGNYRITDTPGINASQDTDARVQLQGETGRRATRIIQDDPTKDVLSLSTLTGNLRGVTVKDLALYGGRHALNLSKCAYLLFDNVGCMQQADYSVAASGSSYITFSNSWWVHLGGNVADIAGGNVRFTGCTFGEDAGSFQSSGVLSINDSTIFQCSDKLEPNGFKDMGKQIFTAWQGGRVAVSGCDIDVGENLLNYDNGDEVSFSNCQINAGTGSLLCVRRHDNGYPIRLNDNTFRVMSDCELYKSFIGRVSRGVFIKDNSVMIGTGKTFDTSALPDIENALTGNLYAELSL